MPLSLRSDLGPITTLDDWAAAVPPKQWKEGRSARELARAWCPAGTAVSEPEEFSALLNSGGFVGLTLGAVYMATDPVTSPITKRGSWIFGAGIGGLVVLIRVFGGLPEGVMYAILIMNALVPLIDRATQPRVFGTGAKAHGPKALEAKP